MIPMINQPFPNVGISLLFLQRLVPVAMSLELVVALEAPFQDLLPMTTFTKDNVAVLIHGCTTSANALLL